MRDEVLDRFLRRQHDEAMALAADSDLLDLQAIDPEPSRTYVATFRCTGLVRDGDGVREADRFDVGIRFPLDYLRTAPKAGQVLTWLGPPHVFHPNIRFPLICAGRMLANTTLVDLLHQVFEIITFQNVCMQEHDALNTAACAWARAHVDRFPIDRRPLRRSRLHAGGVG